MRVMRSRQLLNSTAELMSGVWHGGVPTVETYDHDASLLSAILTGMDWWFTRDFTNIACLDQGGSDKCPCSSTDTTLWSTNWYSNVSRTPNTFMFSHL